MIAQTNLRVLLDLMMPDVNGRDVLKARAP